MKRAYQAPKMEVIYFKLEAKLLTGSAQTLDVYEDEDIFTEMQI